MTPTPQPIKDAAEKSSEQWYYPFDNGYRHYIRGFETGATHPDTEKYYDQQTEAFIHWMLDNHYSRYWGSDKPNDGKFYVYPGKPGRDFFTITELLHLYRQSLTNKNTDKIK